MVGGCNIFFSLDLTKIKKKKNRSLVYKHNHAAITLAITTLASPLSTCAFII
jgi:hypothetical protein